MKKLVVVGVLFIANLAYAGYPTADKILFKNHGVAVGIIIDNCLECHTHDKYREYNLKQCNTCHLVPPSPPTDVRVE